MIYWAPFLHFYQPPIQFHAVLKKICNESYRPLTKLFSEHPAAKVTINISGVLTELLNDHGANDIIQSIKSLAENGQIEFVDSGKYHPILPLIPENEIARQIKLNNQTNSFFFGDVYKPKGFFPPEMCYSEKVASVIKNLGYEWILLSGVACQDKWPLDFISEITTKKGSIKVFYRDDILSNKISFHNLDSHGFIKELILFAKNKKDIYVITALDAETFGHHIQNWEKLFLAQVYETIEDMKYSTYDIGKNIKQKTVLADAHSSIFDNIKESQDIRVLTISELISKFSAHSTRQPSPSSWSTTKEEISNKNFFPLWLDPDNVIHTLLWKYLNLCFDLLYQAMAQEFSTKQSAVFSTIARGLMDRAMHSCQFWWANKERNMWDVNLINKGLMLQEEVVFNAYKAISLSSLDEEKKLQHSYKVSASRELSNKIRDILLTKK